MSPAWRHSAPGLLAPSPARPAGLTLLPRAPGWGETHGELHAVHHVLQEQEGGLHRPPALVALVRLQPGFCVLGGRGEPGGPVSPADRPQRVSLPSSQGPAQQGPERSGKPWAVGALGLPQWPPRGCDSGGGWGTEGGQDV